MKTAHTTTKNNQLDFPSFPPSTTLSSPFAFGSVLFFRISGELAANCFPNEIITYSSVSSEANEIFSDGILPISSVSDMKLSSSK
ncbi:uncharacterized protein MONOS_13199 [Monocercomonoides exilis]|uniref:uncharacterized protein n=1 Tax=Monocercomonoides exilis TaxID=2049356 RepID=UPI00355AAD04|nr:hypothetical protein MONOS_13199 [Monocercomonoides exilis]|eukprot:MONOS_13199.1-p1 / transcript=MONOS_13199.1 / gene=MONOS_13199 / organism=Monocercomonoides_exilis_PA203 / gene_product=unspecified product / transcript_product=unspecified product / location=Mono_scaffold00789:22295-22549(+) / protein_length=85 / sequence_SO=supercontig / SO=protein_coding / is_pseudo=false